MNAQLIVLLVATMFLAAASSRKIEHVWNPQCNIDACRKPDPHSGSYNNLVYVKATGDADIVHYLYSNIGAFTVMLFRTELNSELRINWTNLLSENNTHAYRSISFEPHGVNHTMAYMFPYLYEFNDVKGTANINDAEYNETLEIDTSALVWSTFKPEWNTSSLSVGVFEGRVVGAGLKSGSVKFAIRYPGTNDRDLELPHMLLTPESCSIDFILDSLNPTFPLSKFMTKLVVLNDATQSPTPGITLIDDQTLDDEYTPGTFSEWNIRTGNDASYFQWKPIFYFASPKSLENSTITQQTALLNSTLRIPFSIASAFIEDAERRTTSLSVNITFGLPGTGNDGYFYPGTNYSSWTFALGVGAKPAEGMSLLVKIVIGVGFGVPLIIIVVGLIAIAVRKVRRSSYSQFNEL